MASSAGVWPTGHLDDLLVIDGNRELLVGRLQERYGLARDRAERQLEDWEKTALDRDPIERNRITV